MIKNRQKVHTNGGTNFLDVYFRDTRTSVYLDYSTNAFGPTAGANCNFHFHQIYIENTIRVYGYERNGTAAPSSSFKFKSALYRSSPTNGLPTTLVPDSLEGAAPTWDSNDATAAIGTGFYVRNVLTKAFVVTPGLYWIATLSQSPTAGTSGTWNRSLCRGGHFGLPDLQYTASTVLNANIDTFTFPENISAGDLAAATDSTMAHVGVGLILRHP